MVVVIAVVVERERGRVVVVVAIVVVVMVCCGPTCLYIASFGPAGVHACPPSIQWSVCWPLAATGVGLLVGPWQPTSW